jgi:hypothetical protein
MNQLYAYSFDQQIQSPTLSDKFFKLINPNNQHSSSSGLGPTSDSFPFQDISFETTADNYISYEKSACNLFYEESSHNSDLPHYDANSTPSKQEILKKKHFKTTEASS